MAMLTTRDVEYWVGTTRMIGFLAAPTAQVAAPGVVLLHDAFGLSPDFKLLTEKFAELGYAVFAADLWGNRRTPRTGEEIGALIGGLTSDRADWMGRVVAAHEKALEQPEFSGAIVTVGYCFGGSSALEYLRLGGQTDGIVTIHAGLDLLGAEWSARTAQSPVIVLTGADDPMATPEQWQRLKGALEAASIPWEFDLYSGARHAFSNPKANNVGMPHVAAYQHRAATRSWARTIEFLKEVLQTATSEGKK